MHAYNCHLFLHRNPLCTYANRSDCHGKKILRFSFFFLDFTLSSSMHKYYVVDEIYGFVKFDRVV